MNQVRLRYDPDDEWSGKLTAICEADGFAGQGSAWFSSEEVRAFGRATENFPLSREAPPFLQGGLYDDKAGALSDVHLGIRIEQHNARGLIRVTVELATEVWTTPEEALAAHVLIRFLVTYSDIGRFGADIEALIGGSETEITLGSSTPLL